MNRRTLFKGIPALASLFLVNEGKAAEQGVTSAHGVTYGGPVGVDRILSENIPHWILDGIDNSETHQEWYDLVHKDALFRWSRHVDPQGVRFWTLSGTHPDALYRTSHAYGVVPSNCDDLETFLKYDLIRGRNSIITLLELE